uniref:Uncharacterized protein n=1 Tax=Rhizophora mucronata TaxID=61149 RepID=A0A2P2JN15_RHIMU
MPKHILITSVAVIDHLLRFSQNLSGTDNSSTMATAQGFHTVCEVNFYLSFCN